MLRSAQEKPHCHLTVGDWAQSAAMSGRQDAESFWPMLRPSDKTPIDAADAVPVASSSEEGDTGANRPSAVKRPRGRPRRTTAKQPSAVERPRRIAKRPSAVGRPHGTTATRPAAFMKRPAKGPPESTSTSRPSTSKGNYCMIQSFGNGPFRIRIRQGRQIVVSIKSTIHGKECLKSWGTECLRRLNEGHDVASVKHWLKVQTAMACSSSIAPDPKDLN
jgi:hypothetical protein